jgi:hypothetical protein
MCIKYYLYKFRPSHNLRVTSGHIMANKISVFQNIALTLSAFATCLLLTLAAPVELNNKNNNEEKVGTRFFPGAGYSGFYPGMYPGGFPAAYPRAYPEAYPGVYPDVYGREFNLRDPSIGYPLGGCPTRAIVFYNNKNGNTPPGSKAASGARN